jgi:two-component system C4-dicarboxylate transport response regulator DctD
MPTALVVDDDGLSRSLATRTLAAAGFEVVQARDGFQAIAILSRQASDISLAVVDTEMPGLHGWEVIRYARRKAPRIRVLRLGRRDDAVPAPEYRPLESVPSLSKPFTPARLLGSLKRRKKAPAA